MWNYPSYKYTECTLLAQHCQAIVTRVSTSLRHVEIEQTDYINNWAEIAWLSNYRCIRESVAKKKVES